LSEKIIKVNERFEFFGVITHEHKMVNIHTKHKYDKRIELYDKGVKQWDTNMSVTMIMRGIK